MNTKPDAANRDAGAATESTLEQNRQVWDRMAREGKPLCQPATDAQLANPLQEVDPLGWLGPSIEGWKVLCLAAGGGRHSALYSAAGAQVTVVDLSPEMLRLDREVAAERGLPIRVIQCSMESMPMLVSGEFDLIVQPVSTCYVPSLQPVFSEVARLLRPAGLYISQHKQPVSLQSTIERNSQGRFELVAGYYRNDPVPPPARMTAAAQRLREHGSQEYLHRWEQLIGGLCRAGFVIEDLIEPMHARGDAEPSSFADRACFIAPYVRLKARRRISHGPAANGTPSGDTLPPRSALWLP